MQSKIAPKDMIKVLENLPEELKCLEITSIGTYLFHESGYLIELGERDKKIKIRVPMIKEDFDRKGFKIE